MKIETEAYTTQDNDDFHDVDCLAWYENNPQQWKINVSFNKETQAIEEGSPYQYSPNVDTHFEKIDIINIPSDILECLQGRVEAAKDDILT